MVLYLKSRDVYYDPSKAQMIAFEGDKATVVFGAMEDNVDDSMSTHDPDEIEELRRWCQKHTEPLS